MISCSNTAHAVRAYLHHLSSFFNDVCVRINNIYACCGDQLAWRFNPPSQLPNNSLPDFVLMPLDDSDVGEMVGEGKVKTNNHCVLPNSFPYLSCSFSFTQCWTIPDSPMLWQGCDRVLLRKLGFASLWFVLWSRNVDTCRTG